MKNQSHTTTKDETKAAITEPPAPEVLKTQNDEVLVEQPSSQSAPTTSVHKARVLPHRVTTYRPSHKATFIGLGVVVAILAINAVIIAFVVQGQDNANAQTSQADVVISPAVLDTLGVSRNAVGNLGTELVVGPNSRFDGTVTVGSDVSIGGELKLNGKLSVSDASLTSLQAGNTSLNSLTVNGDASASNLNLSQNLTVVGSTRLQGPVTIDQLLTVNNNVSVIGSLSVGGTLTARNFQASSLTSDTTLTIGGHVITRGAAPGISAGNAVGSNGTVSVSGNDAAGTVAVNVGVGAIPGTLAQITFRAQYGGIPRVVVTAIGRSAGSFYVNRSSTGFSIVSSSSLSAGGYAFDYIVMQ